MTSRALYSLVMDLLDGGAPRQLLGACICAMRTLRDLPHQQNETAQTLLQIPTLVETLRRDDALATIYQAMNAPVLEAAYRSARLDRRKFAAEEIPAVTQLFTPRWVVEFLVHNTLGRLWLRMHPDSRIELPWLVSDVEPVPHTAPRKLARELRILDPACGTMNFGIVAAEVFLQMYREELHRAGESGWPARASVSSESEIPATLLEQNIIGCDLDPTALWLARETLWMKLRVPDARDQLVQGDTLLDPTIAKRLDAICDIVVTNPPYVSSRNLSHDYVRRMKQAFPASWRDQGTCFIERCLRFLRDGGRAGLLAMQSFMFTAAFEPLRRKLLDTTAVEMIAHFGGGGVFEVGNPGTLQTAAFVLRRECDGAVRSRQSITGIQLTQSRNKCDMLSRSVADRNYKRHVVRQVELQWMPRAAWVYWLSPQLRSVFARCRRLAERALPRQGLATTDNARFVRYWWEVEPAGIAPARVATTGKWFPYAKSGRFRRWHEATRHRVDWQDDGRAIKQSIVERYPYLDGKWQWVAKNTRFYGQPGITYSYLTSGSFSARLLEAGSIFDVAASSLFPDDPLNMLAVLNSSVATDLLRAINPTVNFQVGDLAQLPIPGHCDEEIPALVQRCIAVQRQLDASDETSADFAAPLPWDGATDVWQSMQGQLRSTEKIIQERVARLYEVELPAHDRSIEPLNLAELARRWIGFTLRHLLDEREWVQISPLRPVVLAQIKACVERHNSSQAIDEIAAHVGGIDRFLRRDFADWHATLYGGRPVLWVLGGDESIYVIRHDRVTARLLKSLLRNAKLEIPQGWDRFIDDGIAINLSALGPGVRGKRLQRGLAKVWKDVTDGRRAWSETARACLPTKFIPAPTGGFVAARPRQFRGALPSPGARGPRT